MLSIVQDNKIFVPNVHARDAHQERDGVQQDHYPNPGVKVLGHEHRHEKGVANNIVQRTAEIRPVKLGLYSSQAVPRFDGESKAYPTATSANRWPFDIEENVYDERNLF